MNTATINIQRKFETAISFQKNGELSQATDIYRSILRALPNQPGALSNLAIIEYTQGNIAEAKKLFSNCIIANPKYTHAKFCLAELYCNDREFNKALDLYNQGYTQELKLINPRLDLNITLKAVVVHIINTTKNNQPIELDRIKHLSTVLVASGEIERLLPELLGYINDNFKITDYPERESISIAVVLSHFLGLRKSSPKLWNEQLFKKYHLPLMHQALKSGYLDFLLEFETLINNNYVKQTETEEHFHHCFSQWLPLLRQAGSSLSKLLPPPPNAKIKSKKTKLGFFFHNTSTMAHVHIVINFIKGMCAMEDPPFEVKIYFFCGDYQPTIQVFLKLGAEVTVISDLQPIGDESFVNRMIILRNMASEDDVTAMVWVTLPTLMSFAFALRVAPIQIWWGMKYHNLSFPEIDAYLGLGAFEKNRKMYGINWRIGHTVFDSAYKHPDPNTVRTIRRKYSKFDIILSSIAREDKINNPLFLNTITTILKRNPSACYLWPGSRETESITRFFTEQGVSDQCIFIGWIDTKLYSEVIDIYVDSFPFPCATTIIDAMLCAKPIVMINTKESKEIGIPMLINPAIEGTSVSSETKSDISSIFNLDNKDEKLLLIADDTEEYIQYTEKLILEKDFRKKSGEAYKAFTEKYLQDINLMAKSYCQHFTEILESAKVGELAP